MKRRRIYFRSAFLTSTVLTLAVKCCTYAADYQATVMQDHPIGYWRLGESSGAVATNLGSLGSAAAGTASATVAFGQPGALVGDTNTAAGFDGAVGKIEVPYAEALNPLAYTYEVWANVTPDSSGAYRSPLASRDDTPASNTAGVIFYADPADNWQFWNGRGNGGWHNLGGGSVIPGQWSHLVGTYDGTNKAFYVDGVLVGGERVAFQPNRGRVLRIGASANEDPVGQFFFNGSVDEAAVYSGALSGDRVLAHYKAGSGADPIPVAPVVVAEPQALAIFKGDSPQLSVLATGSLPLTYQWKFNDADLPGATNYSLTLTNVQPANGGTYRVVVKNSEGEAISADALVQVSDIGKPEITQQPRSRTVLPGATATLMVAATGSATFAYQWQFNGANLVGATNASLTITNIQAATAGTYRVTVTNPAGSVTSADALLQIPPAATKTYVETIKEDAPVSFWRLDETSGDVAKDSIDSNPGTYLNGVTLGAAGALAGDTNTAATFAATGSQKIDVPYNPALNTSEFTVELWAKVTGGTGYRSPLTSRADGIQRGYIFYAAPDNTWQFWTGKGDSSGWDTLGGPSVLNGAWTHLVGVYDGTNKLFYVNGNLVASSQVVFGPNDENVLRMGGGATEGDGSFFFEGSVDEVSYYAKALSEDRVLAHYVAGFPLTTPPLIATQPASKFVPPGATVTFSVSATGGLPLAYQWKFNNFAIAGATNSSLVVTNAQAANAGDYTVTVSNAGGNVTSSIAKLEFPTVTGQSYDAVVKTDQPVGYWRLDEGLGETAFDSVGQNNGTYLNGVTMGVPGALTTGTNIALTNTAARFLSSGAQKIDVPFSPDLNPAVFSVELWARVTGADGTYRSPLTSRGDLPQRGYIFYAAPDNTWQFWTGAGDAGGWDPLAGPAVLKDEWTHLVGTFDGTTKRFYVNGVEVATSTPPFGPNTENPLRFGAGRSETDGDYFFEGDVDEVSVYAKALSATQVVTHFVAGRPPTVAAPGSLTLTRNNGQLILTWISGTLQQSPDVTGSWQDIAGATSPYPVTPSGERRFYRLK
ncbi:MAG: LamG-like jellyroll fold domain-containing protein [Verrucomicrobiota bacterium]